MSSIINSTLIGAVGMASLVATLFFLRFWRQTRDKFFLLFAIAFAIDGVFRFILAMNRFPNETEPLFYLPRLAMFGLIILAVVQKNRPSSH
jgi:hypothetical protein